MLLQLLTWSQCRSPGWAVDVDQLRHILQVRTLGPWVHGQDMSCEAQEGEQLKLRTTQDATLLLGPAALVLKLYGA